MRTCLLNLGPLRSLLQVVENRPCNRAKHIRPEEPVPRYILSKEKNPCSKLSRLYKRILAPNVSGIYDPNAFLQNLSEQDICFDSNLKELRVYMTSVIAKDKYRPPASSFQKIQLSQAMKSETLGTEHLH